jgi:uncharacterized protein YfaA (DUF2138 family)
MEEQAVAIETALSRALRTAAGICYHEASRLDALVSEARAAGKPDSEAQRLAARTVYGCAVGIDALRAREEKHARSREAQWIPISEKPTVGDDAQVVVRFEQDSMGIVHKALGWWCDGPGHFSAEGVENADHLLTHYILLPKD